MNNCADDAIPTGDERSANKLPIFVDKVEKIEKCTDQSGIVDDPNRLQECNMLQAWT